jgi:hypothetical protein
MRPGHRALVERLAVRGQRRVRTVIHRRQPGFLGIERLVRIVPDAARLIRVAQHVMRLRRWRRRLAGGQDQQQKQAYGSFHAVTESPISPTAMA